VEISEVTASHVLMRVVRSKNRSTSGYNVAARPAVSLLLITEPTGMAPEPCIKFRYSEERKRH
jgi:hypothetical protein